MLRGGGTGRSDVLRGGALKPNEEPRNGVLMPAGMLENVGIRLNAGRPPITANDGKLLLKAGKLPKGLASDGKLRLIDATLPILDTTLLALDSAFTAPPTPPPFCIRYLLLLTHECIRCTT